MQSLVAFSADDFFFLTSKSAQDVGGVCVYVCVSLASGNTEIFQRINTRDPTLQSIGGNGATE